MGNQGQPADKTPLDKLDILKIQISEIGLNVALMRNAVDEGFAAIQLEIAEFRKPWYSRLWSWLTIRV